MKNLIKDFQKGIVIGIWFFCIIAITQAWNGLQATDWDALTATKWNELVDKVTLLENQTQSNSWKILQVETYTTTNGGLYNTNAYVDTPIQVTFTPKQDNSKILIMVTTNFYTHNNGIRWGRMNLMRDTTLLSNQAFGAWNMAGDQMMSHPAVQMIDAGLSKNTTYTYKLQVSSPYGYNIYMNNGNTTLTVIEIAGE